MKIQYLIYFCILFFSHHPIQAQQVNLEFDWLWNAQPLRLDTPLLLNKESEPYTILTAKCYISDVQFFNEGELVDALKKKYHLLNLEESESLIITEDFSQDFDSIAFYIGIDSASHYQGAMDGDLDPLNGMYWAWQSGYIFWKIEGKHSTCPARKNYFQFHIGGFQTAHNAIQRIGFKLRNTSNLKIGIDLAQLFREIEIKEEYEIMRPSARAVELSALFTKVFTVQ